MKFKLTPYFFHDEAPDDIFTISKSGDKKIRHLRLNSFIYLDNPTVETVVNSLHENCIDIEGEFIVITKDFTVYYLWDYDYQEIQITSVSKFCKTKNKTFKTFLGFEKYLSNLLK